MAWTAPRTWVTSEVVSASIMNTHVRDNLLETAPGKAGLGFVVGTASNEINVRNPQYQRVNTSETTTSTSFTDLTTSGPANTTTTGTEAILIWGAGISNDTSSEHAYMSVAVSGSTTISATTNYMISNIGDNGLIRTSYSVTLSSLTAGSNTFTAKYRVTGGTGTFLSRHLATIPTR